VARMGGEEGCV